MVTHVYHNHLTYLPFQTQPIWAFCAQTVPKNHCQAGHVFAANTNESSPFSFVAFQSKALGLNGSSGPDAGGPGGSPPSTTNGADSRSYGLNLSALVLIFAALVIAV